MTETTPTTTPTPPEGLTDEQLLKLADNLCHAIVAFVYGGGFYEAVESELIAYARAAIAADRAQRPQEEQMAEALRRIRQWGGWSRQTLQDVYDWIDAGMSGSLPPLSEHFARGEEQSNG